MAFFHLSFFSPPTTPLGSPNTIVLISSEHRSRCTNMKLQQCRLSLRTSQCRMELDGITLFASVGLKEKRGTHCRGLIKCNGLLPLAGFPGWFLVPPLSLESQSGRTHSWVCQFFFPLTSGSKPGQQLETNMLTHINP